MTKQRRVRARIVELGPTFVSAAEKLGPGASADAVAIASTLVDHVHPGPDRVIRMAEVKRLTGLSRSSVLRKAESAEDDFPSAVRLGESSRGWHLWEILDWVRSRARLP